MADASATEADEERKYRLAAVGPEDCGYYLAKFAKFEKPRAIPMSWNWSACFFSAGWLVSRRMYAYALVYLVVLAAALYSWDPLYQNCALRDTAGMALGSYFWANFIVLPMFADWFYFRHGRRRINKVKAQSPDIQTRLNILAGIRSADAEAADARKGYAGIRAAFRKMMIIVAGAAPVAIAWDSAPKYADWTDRAKASEVVLSAGSFKTAFSEYYAVHKRLPNSFAELGIQPGKGRFVKQVALDQRTAAVKVTVTGICSLEGRTLQVVPTVANDRINWQCGIDDASGGTFKSVPAECRNYIATGR